MTYLAAGNSSYKAGKEKMRAGAYADAARDFNHAAEMFERHQWEVARSMKSPAITLSRRFLRTAIQKRDSVAA